MKKRGKIFKQVSTGLIILPFLIALAVLPVHAEEVFYEDFEASCFEPGGDWCGWYADQGIWEIGEPTSGPGGAHSPMNCAGTVLGGNYPTYNESRLISPSLRLPDVAGDEENTPALLAMVFPCYIRLWSISGQCLR